MRLHRGLTPSPLVQGQSLLDAARKLAGEAADRRPGVRISLSVGFCPRSGPANKPPHGLTGGVASCIPGE